MTEPLLQPEAHDREVLEEVVGYLNFSSGADDPKFLANLNHLVRSIEGSIPQAETVATLCRWLRSTIADLGKKGGAFSNVVQAEKAVLILDSKFLPAYRAFHDDLLFHQQSENLWRPFFLGKAWEAILAEGSPWDEIERIVPAALKHLNDYVGYRPVAVLESGGATEPYPHEFVRPIPLYVRGAGVGVGRYEKLVALALEILQKTDADILARAWFDLDRLEEIALDPRAYDFDHPVNRRPNYHFGQWDPHQISSSGFYTRFVLQQVTLDALLSRCECESCPDEQARDERFREGAAVLAGTMLMAAGTSGDEPSRHDSSVTLSTLLPQIAAYRDDFYEQLLARLPDAYGDRLRQEAVQFRQPFGGARQHLNHELARRRALQLQQVHLALLFARLGYPEAAQRQADSVRVASARMLSDIYCRLTAGHDAIDAGRLAEVVDQLTACEDLMHRAIECGALVDPWNVVGFAGNFSLFPALENTVHDWRVDELIELIEQVLDLAARAWSEAAAIDDTPLEQRFSVLLERMADWWDQFASASVEGVKRFVAKETSVSANLVAGALNAWHKAGSAAGDIAFWRMFVDQFDSPKAFLLVIEALLDHGDTVASMALMMQWVSQKERAPLDEGEVSFGRLAYRWLALVEQKQAEAGEDRWAEVARFFDYLEANAEEYWQVPSLLFDAILDSDYDEVLDEIEGAEFFDDEEEDEEDEEDELFGAAYEEMVYRDSTDDGHEGDLADEGEDWETTEWEYEVRRLEQRLEFLSHVAGLWKQATLVWGKSDPESERAAVIRGWLQMAGKNYDGLVELLEKVHNLDFELPTGSHDSLVEYDRLRTIKEAFVQQIIATCVETADAARLLAAGALQTDASSEKPLDEPIDLVTIEILRAVLAGDAEAVRSHWENFVASLKPRKLLYIPHSRGGEPRTIVATRGLQQLVSDLLGWLPQLGLIRETCQLLQVAQEMETRHPVGQGAVTEFDRLFENGYQAIVRTMVVSAEQWDPASIAESNKDADHLLFDSLRQLTEQQLKRWLKHSQTLRLSIVEKLDDEKSWNRFVEFIRQFGGDLFTQRFMSLGNLRGILHQGVDLWLESLEEEPETAEALPLVEQIHNSDWDRVEAIECLTIAMEAVVENYRVYRDYNTTTTQSDHGELLYTLIDFLRLRATYDRVAWKIKPVVWAHEILVRHKRDLAAEMWCQDFAQRTAEAADMHQEQLEELSQKYGMRLATVADRIGDRFVRPLLIDRVKSLIEPALTAAPDQRRHVIAALEHEIESFASEPSGAGLDLPDWLAALEDEVAAARARVGSPATADNMQRRLGQVRLGWQELLDQLEET